MALLALELQTKVLLVALLVVRLSMGQAAAAARVK